MTATSWTPAAVEELIFRQFLKGEDVSHMTPASVDKQKLPDHEPCVKSLFKYVECGPAPVNRGNNTPSPTPMRNALPPQSQQACSSNLMPRPNNTAASSQQQQTPSTPGGGGSRLAQRGRDKSMPRTPRVRDDHHTGAAGGATAERTGGLHDQMKRRRVEWPVTVPTDAQLKGAQRSALQPQTEKRIAAQAEVDPDLIFRQETAEFPLTAIFGKYPAALKLISQTRGLSGDWRKDSFTAEEEAEYKTAMGYTVLGSSQAQPTAAPCLF